MAYDDRNLGRDTKIRFAGHDLGHVFAIGDVKGSRSTVDVTPYGSDCNEYVPCTLNPGTLDVEIANGAAGNEEMLTAFMARTIGQLELEFASGKILKINAMVIGYGKSVKINDVLRTPVTFQLSGKPTVTEQVIISGADIVRRGYGTQLNASSPVVWSLVSSTTDPTTTISDTGYLYYGADEQAPEIEVMAVSASGAVGHYTVAIEHEPLRIMQDRITVARGSSVMITASQPIQAWEIATAHSAGTTIDGGLLMVSASELQAGVWIRCHSVYNDTAIVYAEFTDPEPKK